MLLPHSVCFGFPCCSKSLPLTSVMPSAGMPAYPHHQLWPFPRLSTCVPCPFKCYPKRAEPQPSLCPQHPEQSLCTASKCSVATPESMDRDGHTWPDFLSLSEVSWAWVTLKLIQEAQKEVTAGEVGPQGSSWSGGKQRCVSCLMGDALWGTLCPLCRAMACRNPCLPAQSPGLP